MWKKIGSILLLCVSLYAADIEITTAVDRQVVPVNQTVQYTLSVDSAADIPGLNLPTMTDFVVLGQSSATQIQIINGKQTGSRSYIYVLQPKQQGKALIPGFSFVHKQQKYFTKSIEITVGAPEAVQKAADPFSVFGEDDFFKPVTRRVPAQTVALEMIPQKRTLYVGEKTQVELRFYFERGFYQGPQYIPPTVKGLVAKTIASTEKPLTVNYKGKQVQMLKIVQEVYPLAAGTAELGSAQMQFVDSPLGGVQTLQTQPIAFKVKTLPAQPADFSGAIGAFTLQVSPIAITAKTGAAIPLTITVRGQGNLDMVNTLPIPAIPSCNLFLDGMTSDTISRTYKYFITPFAPGTIALPGIAFTYFDVVRGEYQTARVQLPIITVRGAVIQDKQGQIPEYTDSAINIRVDRHFVSNIVRFIFTWVLGGALFVGGLYGVYTLWQMPRRALRRDYQSLASVADTQFIGEAYKLFSRIVMLRFHVHVAGASTEYLTKQVPAPQATTVLKMVQIFEEARYAGQNLLPRAELMQLLRELLPE